MAKLAGGLSSGFDGSDGDDAALWQAQELMYEAWDTGAKRERIELAKRALEDIRPLRRCSCAAGGRGGEDPRRGAAPL